MPGRLNARERQGQGGHPNAGTLAAQPVVFTPDSFQTGANRSGNQLVWFELPPCASDTLTPLLSSNGEGVSSQIQMEHQARNPFHPIVSCVAVVSEGSEYDGGPALCASPRETTQPVELLCAARNPSGLRMEGISTLRWTSRSRFRRLFERALTQPCFPNWLDETEPLACSHEKCRAGVSEHWGRRRVFLGGRGRASRSDGTSVTDVAVDTELVVRDVVEAREVVPTLWGGSFVGS